MRCAVDTVDVLIHERALVVVVSGKSKRCSSNRSNGNQKKSASAD